MRLIDGDDLIMYFESFENCDCDHIVDGDGCLTIESIVNCIKTTNQIIPKAQCDGTQCITKDVISKAISLGGSRTDSWYTTSNDGTILTTVTSTKIKKDFDKNDHSVKWYGNQIK